MFSPLLQPCADDEVEKASSSDDEVDMSKPTSTSALSQDAVYKVICFSLCSTQVVHVLFVAIPERPRQFGCPGLVGPFVFVPLNLAVNIVIFHEFVVQQRLYMTIRYYKPTMSFFLVGQKSHSPFCGLRT
jgi:hypothetical protein